MTATNPPGSSVANDQGNGYMIADGFGGPNNGPATFPNGLTGNISGNISGNQTLGNLTVTGVVAAGNVTSAGGASGTFNLASTGNITVAHGIITVIGP